jgi:hypothetical protein
MTIILDAGAGSRKGEEQRELGEILVVKTDCMTQRHVVFVSTP